ESCALRLAAGELTQVRFAFAFELAALKRVLDGDVIFFPASPLPPLLVRIPAQHYHLFHGQPAFQFRALRHESDRPRYLGHAQLPAVFSIEQNLPACCLELASKGFEESRFTGAVCPCDNGNFRRAESQADVFDNDIVSESYAYIRGL